MAHFRPGGYGGPPAKTVKFYCSVFTLLELVLLLVGLSKIRKPTAHVSTEKTVENSYN